VSAETALAMSRGREVDVKLEVVVRAERVAAVVDAIAKTDHACRTGADGIVVLPVRQVIRVRNGERGGGAI
jgi:nitrogen regulatory protein PII